MVFPLRNKHSGPLEWDFFDEDGIPKEEKVVDEDTHDDRQALIDDDDERIEVRPTHAEDPSPGPINEHQVQEETGEDVENKVPSGIEEAPPRRSARERKPVERYTPSDNVCDNPSNYLHECREAMKPRAEPKSYKLAMKSEDAKEWRAACDKEMKSIRDMGVWEVVDRPKNYPVVGGRWHFKLKLNPDGSVNKHKARYVATGYTQTEGIDYNDTFAPTGRLASFRILVAIAAAKGWDIEQMDAIAAFLNSDLKERIYLELPGGTMTNEQMAKWQCSGRHFTD